ncbi:hypothetical protein KSP40_PGU019584 [Platanthera guangdongensis]|uniref:Uncharacterized protein n=1 Tax=Platanthera guangdongensis TaxID=2320717 RepID=A0ABR2MJV8_9ASPA
MSGNEITGIHNFFEENSSHQSQVVDSGCVVSNNNSWIGTHGLNRVTTSSDHTDTFGIGLSQFSLKQHFDTIQTKNQQLNLNELMHASSNLQGRSAQAKFQRESAIPNNNHSLMQRGLPNFGSQEGNSPGYGSGFPGSLEKPESAVSPVNFDFLRGHQQLSSQHPGLSQTQHRQQQGSNEMQWKQHLIAMQMQEIQRQQQLQQLQLGARQHNSFNQIYGATGQGGGNEFPAMLSGMPIANVSNYMPVDLMGFQSKSPSSSHMLSPGNMNWAQRNMQMMPGMPNGLMYSPEQGQPMLSMGYIPRQLDESLHGTPVSGGLGSLNHYFQLQGMSHDGTSVDLMSKLGENHAERTSMQSSGFNDFHSDQRPISNEGYSGASFVAGRQGAQGKTSFGNALVQNTNIAVMGSIHQPNHLTESAQVQEFQDGRQRNDWLGKSHESIVTEVTPHIARSLDPTEEKLLFGFDDGTTTSLGGSSNRVTGTYMNGYPMQNNDSLSVFPSLQSGTWSALVQEALEASSSDTGQHEEWSGLSLQKTDPKADNHLALFSDNGNRMLQSYHSASHSQQPIKYAYEQNERLEPDNSIQSFQQLPKENNEAQFPQDYQPYNFIGNSIEERKQQPSAPSNGVWTVQEHEQTMHSTDSAEIGSNSHRTQQHSWIHQQKMPFYNVNSQSGNKQSGWGAESPSSSGSRNFKNDENNDLNHYSRSNDVNTAMHMEMAHARSLGKVGENRDVGSFNSLGGSEPVKSEFNNRKMSGEQSYSANFPAFMNANSFRSNMVVNQQLLNRQPEDPLKRVAGHLFVKDKETNQITDPKQLNACLQDWDHSPGYTNTESGKAHGHAVGHLSTSHSTIDGRNESSDSLLAQNDHLHLTSGSQKLSDQSGQRSFGSRRFQFHPMGNLEINMEPTNQESNKSQLQGPAHPMTWGLKNQERENFGNSHVVGHAASSISVDVGKTSALAELQHTSTFSGHNQAIPSFGATTANYSQEKRVALPSQNVPMFFDKANHSDDPTSVAKLNISENISSSGIPEGVSSDGPTSHMRHSQGNPLQDSSSKLAHPSQRHSSTMHASAEGSHRAWSSSTTSAVVLPTIHETSQRENLDYKIHMSPQSSKDTLFSNTKGNPLGAIPNIRNQLFAQQQQQQSVSCPSRQAQFDPSVNHSFGNKVSVDGHPKHLHHPSAQSPCDRSPTNQTSLPAKVPDSRLNYFADGGAPMHSQFQSPEGGNSEMINVSSDRRNTIQLQQGVETVSANEPSVAPVASQQGHYSSIFNNVWRNAASHRPSGLQTQKFATNLLQAMNHLEPPHQNDQRSEKGGNSSEVGTCSTNSQQFAYEEESLLKSSNSEPKHGMGMDVSLRVSGPSFVQGQESKNHSDKNPTVSVVSSSVRSHPHDNKKGKHVEKQMERMNFTTVSPSNDDIQKHNYSLLQQMQAMKGADSDPSRVDSKRIKVTDMGCGEFDAVPQTENVKMLSFSSREIEERSGNASGHLITGDLASSSRGQDELQNSSLGRSALNLTAVNERRLINPQMAPSWFEQYETFKDNQASGASDILGSSQRSAKAATQNYFFSKTSEQLDNEGMLKRSCDNILENSSPTTLAADSHSSHLKLMVTDENSVPVRKKRKIARIDLLSWHKEVTQSSGSLQSFSLAKMKWAQATNRLIEKIEDDTETIDDVPSIIRSRKRLILVTQLMQQIFPPVPSKLLFEDSMMSYEKVIYYLTKLTLGEVCGVVSSLGSDSVSRILEKLNTPRKMREEMFSNIVENFVTRSKKLQSIFPRLDGGPSIVDYRMECQDVERGSIINRFAKFHGRGPTDGAEGSSALEAAPRRFFPQTSFTMLPMPKNIPDGVFCLSL